MLNRLMSSFNLASIQRAEKAPRGDSHLHMYAHSVFCGVSLVNLMQYTCGCMYDS